MAAMKLSLVFSSLLAASLGGCITPPPLSAPGNDPTNPQAHGDAGPRRPPSLVATTKKYLSTSEGANAQKMGDMGGMSMAGGDMKGMDHSKMPGMQSGGGMEGMDHSKMEGMGSSTAKQPGPAGKPRNQSEEETAKQVAQKSYYTCVMHPEVRSDRPGKCPKCGMTLVLKQPEGGSMPGMSHGEATPAQQSAPPASGMEGMDHSKMPGMEPSAPPSAAPPADMQGMDHSKMPGMGNAPSASPADAAQIAAEMKKTSEEMKKVDAELKKVQAQQNRGAKQTPKSKAEERPHEHGSPAQPGGMEGMPGMQHGAPAPSPTAPLSGSQHQSTHPSYYTCPMHPEVRSDKPGQCPKCGMTLVTAEAQQKAEEQRHKLESEHQ